MGDVISGTIRIEGRMYETGTIYCNPCHESGVILTNGDDQ